MMVRELHVRYDETPAAKRDGDRLHVAIPTDAERAIAPSTLALVRPGAVREAILTLGDVFDSDLRRKAADRSDYLAYLMKSGKKATKAVWEAQKAFLEAQYGEAKKETSPLDPLLTLSPEGLSFEAFSKDESAYARLVLAPSEATGAWVPAKTSSTTIPWTRATRAAVSQIRGFRETILELAPSVATERVARAVPYRWLRAFGQTMLAAGVPSVTFDLRPIDLYNVLLSLRRRKAKKPPRGLRYELVPGERPRIVLEPWDLVIDAMSEPWTGSRATVVRTYGRDRLQLLARLLPHAVGLRVHLGASGMPTFYVMDLGGGSSFSLALSGWTDSGWAGISLLERKGDENSALLLGGRAVFDLTTGKYFRRELLAEPADPAKLLYRDATDEKAHRLYETKDAVTLEKIHALGPDGTRIEGVINDVAAHRKMRTTLTLDREGKTSDASCTCARFLRAGVREGPCEHMIALRLTQAADDARLAAARATPEGRKLIRAETKSFIRRRAGKAEYVTLSLDDRAVVARRGPSPASQRVARLFFASAEAARGEYFERIERLQISGFMDAQLDPQEVRL